MKLKSSWKLFVKTRFWRTATTRLRFQLQLQSLTRKTTLLNRWTLHCWDVCLDGYHSWWDDVQLLQKKRKWTWECLKFSFPLYKQMLLKLNWFCMNHHFPFKQICFLLTGTSFLLEVWKRRTVKGVRWIRQQLSGKCFEIVIYISVVPCPSATIKRELIWFLLKSKAWQ